MGISQSFAFNAKRHGNHANSVDHEPNQNVINVMQNSSDEDNDKKSEDSRPFSNLNEDHKKIINIAIASALKRMQSEQNSKEQEQEKKIISSINRYYQQNKGKHKEQVDAENMTQFDYEVILKTLRKHHLFKELFQLMGEQRDFFSMFLLTVKKKTFKFRDYIYKQYDPPSNFYIIAEGKLFVQLNSMGLKPLGRGDYFGLESIIYDSDQGESVKVKSVSAILYEINREEISKVHKKISQRSKNEIKQLLEEKIIFFNFLDNKEKQNLLNETVRSTYSKGEIIFQKDYDANAFFVIKKGYVLIKIPHKKDLILEAGSSFGQSSFYQHKGQRVGKAIAFENNTVIYAIGSKAIFKSLGNKIDCAVLQNLQKWALYRDSVINEMYFSYNYDMDKLLDKFKVKKGQKFEVLARKGEPIDKIFMNVRCQINFNKDLLVFNSRSIKTLLQKYLHHEKSEKQFCNSSSKFMRYSNHSEESDQEEFQYEVDIIVTQKGSYAEAKVTDVVDLIIQAIEEPEKHKGERNKIDLSVKSIQKYAKLRQTQSRTTILAVQKHFGIQAIVKVYHKSASSKQELSFDNPIFLHGKKHFEIQKSSLLKEKDYAQIRSFKAILESLNNPSICGFYKAEQDKENIYLIFQYIKGVTLFEVQRELGIMPERIIKFYVLKLALILEYLHSNQVVYRHLTIDNVIIDNKGYPNIFDFKNAKRLEENSNYRTKTLIGTPHYIPPEMVQKNTYSYEVDYWQLGVILYQLIYEKLPFGNNTSDPMKIFQEINEKQPYLKKQNSASLLLGLLQKEPVSRIQSYNQLVHNKYFMNYDWEQVNCEKMIPPYIPKHKTKRFKNIQVFIRKDADRS